MSLSHLVYVSRATRSFTQPQLEHLVGGCQRNNGAVGITGLLLHNDGNFMQLVEGGREALEKLFERIVADERHTQVEQVMFQDVRERLFPQWKMGLLNLSGERDIDRSQLDWLLRHLRHPNNARNGTADALALLGDFQKQAAVAVAVA